MMLIREIMYCKPGKVKPMIEKFIAMDKMGRKAGLPKMRILTDFAGEQYWTIIAEMEVASVDEFEKMMTGAGQSAQDQKEMEKLMEGYHDLVDRGRREIFKIEG